jgi:LacI family transcriptional regulator
MDSLIGRAGRRRNNVVTIRDVAKHAGVSPMTVSRVVNGETKVRAPTRDRVAASIKALNYAPNLAARSLASADPVRIALLYSNPSAAYLSEFLIGSLEQSSLIGCQLLIEKCDGPQGARAAFDKLIGAGAGGFILPPPLCDSALVREALKQAGALAVAVDTAEQTDAVSTVRIDDFEAARVMTHHLLSMGHRDIALIKGHPDQTSSHRREQGYRSALAEAGLKPKDGRVAQGYFTYRSGLEAAEQLLSGPSRPTAIFASNDDMAAAAVAMAHRLKLDVPADVTIVGFDDTALATTVWPSLTTVRQPIADMARTAVMLLVDMIRRRRDGLTPEPMHQMLDFALIERDSTAPVATG